MKKVPLFLISLTTVLVVSAMVITLGKPTASYKKGVSAETDFAVRSAVDQYRKRVMEGMDLSKTTCLTNDLMPGWVVDIVHSPRESVDDLPENQCPALLEGRATHFVELDTGGNLVRVE